MEPGRPAFRSANVRGEPPSAVPITDGGAISFALRARLGLAATHYIEGKKRLRESATRSHLGGNPNCFHDLLFGGAFLQSEIGVAADSIGTLGDLRHRDRDEFLEFRWQRAIGKYPLAERPEGAVDCRRRFSTFLRQISGNSGVYRLVHGKLSA